MIKQLLLISCLVFSIQPVLSQDHGNVNIHFGSIAVYSTYSLGYESPDLLKFTDKHQVRPVIRFGGWSSSYAEQNRGFQNSLGISYLFGASNHHLEVTNELVNHFDRGLKGQSVVFISSTYRGFIGYRYQSTNNGFLFRIGSGWREVVQLGVGYSF